MLDCRSKLTWFQLRDPKTLGYFCGIEVDLVLACGSKLTCFLCGVQNWLRLCVRAESYLVIMCGSKLTWFCVRTGIDLFLVRGSIELTLYQSKDEIGLVCGWSTLIWFQCRDRNWPVFCAVKVGFVFVWGRKLLGFSGGIELLGFVWVVEIDLVFVRGPKINGFWVSIDVDFVFVCGGALYAAYLNRTTACPTP